MPFVNQLCFKSFLVGDQGSVDPIHLLQILARLHQIAAANGSYRTCPVRYRLGAFI